MRLAAEDLLNHLLHLGRARHTAHKHDFIDVGRTDTRILERLLARTHGALQQIIDERLVLRARERKVEVLRTILVGRDERQVD